MAVSTKFYNFNKRPRNHGFLGKSFFIGALDGYSTNAIGVWSISKRILSTYNGKLIRIRRSSDNAELDVGFDAQGNLNVTELNSFVGGGSWFLRYVYDQTGNGRHLGNSTAAQQPQGAIDGNNIAYVYAPGAGFTSTTLACLGLSIAVTNTTQWTVNSSAGFSLDLIMVRDNAQILERRTTNLSNGINLNLNEGTGTSAQLTGTNSGLYSITAQTTSTGNRLSTGTISATGTRSTGNFTINQIGMGNGGGGPFWVQNGRFYAGGLWSTDLGNSNADAVNTIGKTLFNTQ